MGEFDFTIDHLIRTKAYTQNHYKRQDKVAQRASQARVMTAFSVLHCQCNTEFSIQDSVVD